MADGLGVGRELGDHTLRSFLDRGPFVAFIKDASGRYLYLNEAMEHLFGVRAADVQGHTSNAWLPEHLADIIREQDPLTLATNRPVETTVYIERPGGAIEHWRVTRFPFPGPDGSTLIGGVAVNVTDLQDAMAALAESERRYRHLVEAGQGLICTHDMEGCLLSINQAALTLTGLTSEQVIGRNLREFLGPQSRDVFSLYLERMQHIGSDAGMMFLRASSGRELVWKYRNIRVDEPGGASYVLGHAQDVTDLHAAEEQLRQLAMTDDLTGLFNRRGFLANGSRSLHEAVRYGRSAAVFYVDIDGLKGINDQYGHDAGSALIKATAEALKNSFRAADVLARIGGDEFVALVIVPPDDISTITRRLTWHLDKFNATAGVSYRLALSIGVAHFDPRRSDSLESLISDADAAMYRHKRPAAGGSDRTASSEAS
jgi:diguanylate cyclase (GGDEF)-like protein/PAS domain S-box-containing protein